MSGMASAIDGSPLAMRNAAGPRARNGSRYGDFICQTTWLSIGDRDRYGPVSILWARGSHTAIVVSGTACRSRIALRRRACSGFCAPWPCGATHHRYSIVIPLNFSIPCSMWSPHTGNIESRALIP